MAGPVPTDHSDVDVWGAELNAHLAGHAVPATGALILVKTGTGTPEGVITAPVGTAYLRSDGGSGTTLYVKESGAGNTGWVAKGATANAPAGGVATKLIAASDAPAAVKSRADLVCDGTADDVDIQSFMSVPGYYRLSEGNFNFASTPIHPSVDGVTLEGSGWFSTIINRTANSVMFDFSGADSANHRWNVNFRNMKLNGGGSGFNAPMVRCYYAGPGTIFENLWIRNGGGSGIEGVEWWDARLDNIWLDNLGLALGSNTEALRILSTKEGVTVGNFGYSVDSSNNIWATNLLFTSNRKGDIVIAKNGGAGNVHRMYFKNAKFENQNVRNGQAVVKLEGCVFSSMRDFNIHPVSFDSGQSTAFDCFDLTNASIISFDHIVMEQTAAMVRSIFKVNGGCGGSTFSDIFAEGSGAPTVAGFDWAGTNNNIGFGGLIDASHNGSPTSVAPLPIRKKAGIPVDGDFPVAPLDGTPCLDTVNHRLYIRDGGVWKYAALT